jgi:riboflavin synthase alpha subunit
LTISDCEDILGDANLGDSISVNGAQKHPMEAFCI